MANQIVQTSSFGGDGASPMPKSMIDHTEVKNTSTWDPSGSASKRSSDPARTLRRISSIPVLRSFHSAENGTGGHIRRPFEQVNRRTPSGISRTLSLLRYFCTYPETL